MVLSPSARRSRAAVVAAVSLSTLTIGAPLAAQDEPSRPRITDVTVAFSRQWLDEIIAEAAQRFAIPERWIHVVMRAESAGDPTAVSDAGAMGLMQIMPATWADLRAAHGFRDDPFDPRDNVLAGAAYLRAMYDRFGSPGFLAAYNAGPDRYADYLETGRPLPAETRAYLAALSPLIDASSAGLPYELGTPIIAYWRAAPLFVLQIDRNSEGHPIAEHAPRDGRSGGPMPADDPHAPEPSNELFVRSELEHAP